ncbi:MAG: methionyl-tRNA formyltransferase, partial [Muribaculaceae bacterium]|nr:methionyl-tRNA formyltransferase [Muribaculaceae bacterium]
HNVGDVIVEGKRMFVTTGSGAVEILSLQPAGKKRMDTSAFLLGYHPVNFK